MENLSGLNHKSCKMSMMYMRSWSILTIFVNFKFIYMAHLNKQNSGCFFCCCFFKRYTYSSLLFKVEVTIVEIFRHSLIDLKPCSTENQIFTTKFHVLNILAAKILFFYGRLCILEVFCNLSPLHFFSVTHLPPYSMGTNMQELPPDSYDSSELRLILHERSMWVIRCQRILVIYY